MFTSFVRLFWEVDNHGCRQSRNHVTQTQLVFIWASEQRSCDQSWGCHLGSWAKMGLDFITLNKQHVPVDEVFRNLYWQLRFYLLFPSYISVWKKNIKEVQKLAKILKNPRHIDHSGMLKLDMLTKTVSFSTSKETFQSQFENNNGDMRNSYNIERRNWYHFATNPQLHYSARV